MAGELASPSKKSFVEILSQQSKFLGPQGDSPASSLLTVGEAVKEPSSFKGKPTVFFSDEDVHMLSSPFKFTLVGKFSKGCLNMEDLCKSFQTVGFKGGYNLGLLDHRHVLIQFDLEEDYLHCW